MLGKWLSNVVLDKGFLELILRDMANDLQELKQ